MMHAEIVSIGDELLKGQRVNTNAAEIAAMLSLEGVPLRRITACSDCEDEMQDVFSEALGRSELVLVTGGLGPTRDDRTRNAAQKLLGRGLTLDPASLREVELRVSARGREMTELMRSQAMVVEGSLAIPNIKGTAAGMIISCAPRFSQRHLVLMPGVPVEMQAMMEGTVLPWVRERSETTIIHTPVRTIGIGESTLAEMIVSVEDSLPEGTTVAYLPHGAGVDVMVSTIADLRERAEAENAAVAGAISTLAKEFVYTVGNRSIEETILDMLRRQRETLAVAESCTGGLVASRITDVAGSSEVFTGGFIVYSNMAKEEQLGVSRGLLDAFGAVSGEVARAMAMGCLQRSGASVALAITGIAGPGGATPDKPVGMLALGLARQTAGSPGPHVESSVLFMHGDRLQNKLRFSQAALRMLWESLRRSDSSSE
ncbi:MAG: CinA family nicotinamide mononucleotide deamidase-related protein [Chlorobium sp.]|nr:CinA family nicotinamide mononucleotide deamidase-related protein [Chlorobium phaeovibrioides]NQU46202.1 CinA family nicotinamide mononucleotide deamidase-related protein [Chlorobium sp.]